MRALVLDGRLRYAPDRVLPRRGAGEALIGVLVAGICGTDLEMTAGYRDFRGVLGHEFVGRVVESDTASLIGCRVCGEINISCLSCEMCGRGLVTHCLNRTVIGVSGHDGCFAEYLVLPERNLHLVPDSVTDEEATFVEPLAAAFQIADQVRLDDGMSVAILGDGRLGALCGLVLSSLGGDPLVIGKHKEKLRRLARMGLRTSHVSQQMPSGLDLVVEATGSATGLQTALDIVRPRGTVVLKTTTTERSAVDWSVAVVKELTLLGSRCGPFQPAIESLSTKRIEVAHLVTDRFGLSDGAAAFDRSRESDVHKVLLNIAG
jgi:threonine dehydrogenase-like Zn-dependent dehydrogenase